MGRRIAECEVGTKRGDRVDATSERTASRIQVERSQVVRLSNQPRASRAARLNAAESPVHQE